MAEIYRIDWENNQWTQACFFLVLIIKWMYMENTLT